MNQASRRPLSSQHTLILETLRAAGRPMTAYEVIDALRPAKSCAPPTIYRALNRLIADGLAHRLETLNAYIACKHAHASNSVPIFEICDVCGKAVESIDSQLERYLFRHTADHGFAATRMAIEIHGTCDQCSRQ